MLPLFDRDMRIWSLWMLVASALLLANPWGRFGGLELAAVIGPLSMALDRRIRSEPTLVVGVPALTLLWLVDAPDASVARLLIAWAVLGIGVMLAARTLESQRELEAIAGQVAFAVPDPEAFEQFQRALARELGRARRHERAFAVLSCAARPISVESEASSDGNPAWLRAVAENRACLELRDLLQDELHLYVDVVAARGRVLALVPEIEGVAVEMLIKRLAQAAGSRLDLEVQIGVGCFPGDAVCADELIAVADASRMDSPPKKRAPDRILSRVQARSAGLAPDLQN